MGVTFCTPLFLFPLPLFFFFLLSSAGWDARIRLSIRSYVSACLIQADVSAEWCSFVSKTVPHTHSSFLSPSLSPSFLQRGVMAIPSPSWRETNTDTIANTHTHLDSTLKCSYCTATHKSMVALLTPFWLHFQRLRMTVIWVHQYYTLMPCWSVTNEVLQVMKQPLTAAMLADCLGSLLYLY